MRCSKLEDAGKETEENDTDTEQHTTFIYKKSLAYSCIGAFDVWVQVTSELDEYMSLLSE